MTPLRTIPKKNYKINYWIFAVTILLAVIAFIYSTDCNRKKLRIPVLRGVVTSEIATNDLNEYVNENPNVLLYIADPTDEESRTLEKSLRGVIRNRELNVVYVDIVDTKDKEAFYKSFIKDFGSNSEKEMYLIDTPAFVIIEDGQIVDMVARNGNKVYSDDIELLLDRNEIKGGNDD